jgi:hypothetical protein
MPPAHPSDAITPEIAHPGACFTEADGRLYALGWPYLRYVVDGHKEDAKPLAKIGKLSTRYGREWPRGVATRFVRGIAELDPDNDLLDPAVLAVAENPAPITEDEARALVKKQLVTSRGRGNAWNFRPFVLLLEAMVGAEPILDAIVSGIESFGKERWAPKWGKKTTWDHNPGTFALHAGFLLLRVPPAVAKKQRKRLEALYATGVKQKAPRGEDTVLGGIDCALHGSEGAARSLDPDGWRYLEWYYFVDDFEMLAARMIDSSAAQYSPCARHLWLTNGELIPLHVKNARKVSETASYLDDIGRLKDPRIVDLMLCFIGKKSAKGVPEAWLRAHANIAKPRLRELVKTKAPSAAAAKAALVAI